MTCEHIDRVTLFKETVGYQGLSGRIGCVDVGVVEDTDELVDNVIGVVLRETIVVSVVVISRPATTCPSLPLSPSSWCSDGGGCQSDRCDDDTEQLHFSWLDVRVCECVYESDKPKVREEDVRE